MNFHYPIYTEPTECQDCYKCIRCCPVKSIRVENGHAKIISEMCISCGACVINCPSHAKRVREDYGRISQLMQIKTKVYVSLAPSFVSEFPEYTPGQITQAISKLGFAGVSETALGADLISAQLANEITEAGKQPDGQKLFISSACPAVVEYIKLYMPEYTEYITDIASPLLAHARYLRKLYGDDIGIVFVGPCIAKKRESDLWNEIDVAITFKEFRKLLKESGIELNRFSRNVPASFVPRRAAKGALFPIDGGMIATMKKYNRMPDVRTMSVSGIPEIYDALNGLDVQNMTSPLFMELLACPGGCVNGPGSAGTAAGAIRRIELLAYAESADNCLDEQSRSAAPDLAGTLPIQPVHCAEHSEEEIKAALRSVGKYMAADELNCASCGYDTCRAFAEAMLDNRAEKTMCVSYMRKLAQKKANGLIQAIPSGVVIVDKNLNLVECNLNFARLMGKDVVEMFEAKPGLEGADLTKITTASRFFADVLAMNGPDVIEREIREGKKIFHITVFEIEKEEIAAGVVEDITAPQIQRRRTVSQARKVIDKNLAVVQKIAFLLGENAAETESMLNSIIDSYSDDEDEDQ